jgi:hypothetical protein
VRNDDKWKRKRAKVCRNLGLEYVSDKTNKVVPAKQQGVGCKCIARTVLEDICDKPIRSQSYCVVARLHGV